MSSRGGCVEKETSPMASSKPSASWQNLRRLLASKSKNELLNLIRDLYALTTDNKDFVHAQVLTPKPKAPKTRQPKQPPSGTVRFSLWDRTHSRVSSPGGRHCSFLVSVSRGETVTGVTQYFFIIVVRPYAQ